MNEQIVKRLQALREKMAQHQIDAYLVPTDDFHTSEYIGKYFGCREYVTGFTGSAGTALIMKDHAGLWTDGRYFIQAAQQLEGTTVELFRMGEPGVPTIPEYLKEHMKAGMKLGFDGRCVGASQAEEYEKLLAENGAEMDFSMDLVGEIWEDRPKLSCEPVFELDDCWTGESRSSKVERVRRILKEKGADCWILSSLDDIAWFLNLRGNDIPCNPVFLSYLFLTEDEVLLYANEKAFSPELVRKLAGEQIRILPYDSIYSAIREIPAGNTVLVCKERVNIALLRNIPAEVQIQDGDNPTLLPKAIKNPVECANVRTAHIKDGAAVIRFIRWLKENAGKPGVTEVSAAEKLYELREEQEHFLGNSFNPIISYGPHAAIIHYSASPETDVPIEAKGLVLADTGGQYLEGTTDITRTIVMGPLTEEEKIYFTEVLRGHIALADAYFRHGCTGINLDYLAREPLWRMGKDYNHGTGHGVGYLLNVHEGPNAIRWKTLPMRGSNCVLEEGMITSDEPGYYEEGRFGIRHESLLLCKKAQETEFGQFMEFEELTMVPFDLDGILPERMTQKEKELLNRYHRDVYEKVSPYLTEDEKEWLAEATREI